MDPEHEVESLKARLTVCRQQLESNSRINTRSRKEALRYEIRSLELSLAKALGVKDDDDADHDADHSSDIDPSRTSNIEDRTGGTSTPESAHLPHIASPGRSRSPSPSLEGPSKKPKLEREASFTPLMSTMHIADKDSSDATPSSSSVNDKEVELIRSALVDAGEDDLDLDALLKEQALMEQRLHDMKRQRDDEDEALARSLQNEEYEGSSRQPTSFFTSIPPSVSTPSSSNAPSSSPNTLSSSSKESAQSKLDRARQERMDEEMARIFAETESSSFDLATSPSKRTQPTNFASSSATKPVFPIFDKNAWTENPRTNDLGVGSSTSSSGYVFGPLSAKMGMHGAAPLSSNTQRPPLPYMNKPGALPPTTPALGPNYASSPTSKATASAVQSAAASILASAGSSSSSSIRKPANTIDLTLPVVDLTKNVHDLSDDDSFGYSGPFPGAIGAMYSMAQNYRSINWYDDDDDEGDEEEDDYSYEDWVLRQSALWSSAASYSTRNYSSYDYVRKVSPQESEKELRDLLANIQAAEEDIAPQDRTGTPEGMASHIALLEHQKIGLTWLQKMEEGTNQGGILGDDMGLGKTVQTMALIVSRPSPPIDDDVIWDDRRQLYEPPLESKLVKTKTTLVIAPVALVYQWAEELRTKTQPGLLKVFIHHGQRKLTDPEELRSYDVVITTNHTAMFDFGHKDPNPAKCKPIGVLFKVKFHRVVLDEAHTIKNRQTKASIACARIAANYRWCLTGTPIQNNIDELYSLIRFLGIKPYCEWTNFREKISAPMKRSQQYGPAMQRVQALLKAVCLRRTKTSKVDGKPILNLPDRNVDKVETQFSVDERAFYDALEQRTRDRFNAYVKAGTVMKNYSNILLLLLRLRQACCHPHLINDFDKVTDQEDAPVDKKNHVQKLLDNLLDDVRRRLIERGLDAVECPICMDIGEESVILSKCGHIYCRACITAHLYNHVEDEDRKCPECRRVTSVQDLISVADFNARFNPAPETAPSDPKGKGKAVDTPGDNVVGPALAIEVPEALDQWISSSKIDRMINIVKDVMARGEKVIVFSQFVSLLHLVEKPLQHENIKYLMYHGSMTAENRNRAVMQMTTDPTVPLMLISLKCGSLGLNLTVANHVVMMDPWWNPAVENQAIDRVHRIGQTKNVFVHRLCIPDTVEDRILALQAKKQALADGALGEGEVPKLAKLGLQELMYLFRGG
ncbi:hypothetical protein BGZ75_001111 [Mortierella antarctica]|nr:hypothetical protein BGZ75_001111 [Mortierella antarctica]